jgi:putative selenate reductase
MSQHMHPLPFETLLDWILQEYSSHRSVFGIPEALFFRPQGREILVSEIFGRQLTTPIGPAAGPHTQLAQNILSAWLTGGRFIELKTVQIMDQLTIPRPCIDLADEGYNVEWSQELPLEASRAEYVKAWVLIHLLRRLLDFEDAPFGTIFNMSVGYNLEGILSPRMQEFMAGLKDATEALEPLRETLRDRYPRFADLRIPDQIVSSVTLSTMHGCPPDEIEQIARHLIEDRGLHTMVKLNPTLLGKDLVNRTLHEDLGFTEITIPDSVFAHDLAYDRATSLLQSLQGLAQDCRLTFGVKLSNTLAVSNHRGLLAGEEMYMSGRALYPLTVQLFRKLREDLGHELHVSYSAGADAINVPGLLAAGARPVTVASDLLKPGGVGRFSQYLSSTEDALRAQGARSLKDLAKDSDRMLDRLVTDARHDRRYKRQARPEIAPKVSSPLEMFDCIQAPCIEACAVCQDIPDYAHWIRKGEPDRALTAILHRNPLPACTGYVCTHLCQTRCTRSEYDEPVAIRRLKRFAADVGSVDLRPPRSTSHRVAIIGSGPAGLSAAFYLRMSGVHVTLFEAKDRPGGMLAIAPGFRLPDHVVDADIDRIRGLGVEIRTGEHVTQSPESLLLDGYDAVFVGCGFSEEVDLPIEGAHAKGVCRALEVLDRVSRGEPPELGEDVLVIGGGNTAMDAARTSARITGRPSTVVYRRTREEMPASAEEISDLLSEGNILEEQALPQQILVAEGRVIGLQCLRARPGAPDASGRRRPEPIPGSLFTLPATTVILAIGQAARADFLEGSRVVRRAADGAIEVEPAGRTSVDRVYAGGDITRGPAIIIAACADGRRAAQSICDQLRLTFHAPARPPLRLDDVEEGELKTRRAWRSAQIRPDVLEPENRHGMDPVETTFTAEQASLEASRCLQCQLLCDKCVEVCPNRANLAIRVDPYEGELPRFTPDGNRWVEQGTERVRIAQSRQILHIDELCNECGNCATFCVHDGHPYRDKPRLFLRRDAFEAESDNAFWHDGISISRRIHGATHVLLRSPSGGWIYRTPPLELTLASDFSVRRMRPLGTAADAVSLRPAVEMARLLDALAADAAYLPHALPKKGGR